jgi:TetR/AcrR family transcriptional regulator, transcriptional repressor for nem operon
MAGKKAFDETEVLDKAMNLFWEKGYNATSAQDLVDELGISRSSLYDTYGDKHSLFVKSLLKYRKEWIAPAIEGANTITNAEAYIISLFDFIKRETFDLNSTKGCFWINAAIEMAPTDSEVTAIAKAIMNDTENAFYKAIKKGQKQGVFSTIHTARSLAKFVLNAMSGLRVNVKLDADEKKFDNIMNICLFVLKA